MKVLSLKLLTTSPLILANIIQRISNIKLIGKTVSTTRIEIAGEKVIADNPDPDSTYSLANVVYSQDSFGDKHNKYF